MGNRDGARAAPRAAPQVAESTRLRQALEDLDSFDTRTHLDLYSARRVVELAERYHLQGYDALYFDLARELTLPLATLDHGQRQAAKDHGVTVFDLR